MSFSDGTPRSHGRGQPATPADAVLGTVFLGDTEVRLHERSGSVARRFNRPASPERRREPARELLASPFFVGRAAQLAELVRLLSAGRRAVIEIAGRDGIGKSTLVQEVVADPAAAAFDGVVVLRGSTGFDDQLQSVLEAAYLFDQPYVPLARERDRLLSGLRMLVAIEDFEGGTDEARRLASALPNSSLIFTSDRVRLPKFAATVELGGLDERDGVKLFSYVTGELTGEERMHAALAPNLSPTPLELKLAAAAEESAPAVEAVASGAQQHVWQITGSRASLEMRVLAVFAAFGGGPLDAAFARDMIGFPPEPIFSGLERRGLIDCDGERYSLRPWVLEIVAAHPALPRVDSALVTFGEWLETFPTSPRIVACAEASLALLRNSWYTSSLPDVVRVGRLLGDALLFAGRPNLAVDTYQTVADAASLNKDRVSEAWALHQIGTVYFALGDDDRATAAFHRSLELREKTNNQMSIAVTRHNLSLVLGVRSSGKPRPTVTAAPVASRGRVGWAVAAVAIFIVGTLAFVFNPFVRRPALHHMTPPKLHKRVPAHAGRQLPAASIVQGLTIRP
jgi:tetratricopeptide (TPR) repeat protein